METKGLINCIFLILVVINCVICTAPPTESYNELYYATKGATNGNRVTCPDGKSTCPDKFTCCKGHEKPWVCCAYYKGACCKDGVHCCPRSSHCDEKLHRCVAFFSFVEAVGAEPSQLAEQSNVHKMNQNSHLIDMNEAEYGDENSRKDNNAEAGFSVECPDHKKFCPNNFTCCQTSNSEWGCCEFRQGTCCPDGSHCCPKGFICDEKSKHCVVKNLPFISIQPIRTLHSESPDASDSSNKYTQSKEQMNVEPSVTDSWREDFVTTDFSVECPDHKKFCPDNYTCCHMYSTTSDWGCCKFNDAVCCSDGKSCCPKDYTCDVIKNACIRKDPIVPEELIPPEVPTTRNYTPSQTQRKGEH